MDVTIDRRLEQAARQNTPFLDLRLSLADCRRLDKALRFLRESEASPREIPPAIADAVRTWKEHGRL